MIDRAYREFVVLELSPPFGDYKAVIGASSEVEVRYTRSPKDPQRAGALRKLTVRQSGGCGWAWAGARAAGRIDSFDHRHPRPPSGSGTWLDGTSSPPGG